MATMQGTFLLREKINEINKSFSLRNFECCRLVQKQYISNDPLEPINGVVTSKPSKEEKLIRDQKETVEIELKL
jgi:hypothetical protein